MNKQLVFIPGLFALGILVGIAMMNAREDEKPVRVASEISPSVVGSQQTPSASWTTVNGGEPQYTNELENRIAELELRISELEQVVGSQSESSAKNIAPRANAGVDRFNRLLTVQSLVKAGVSEELAADMMRRRNDIELRKLELRDRASREGYLGTKRYTNELSALLAKETSLREDLGDDAYDQYLYSNGRPNRVKVASVMLGSAAETAGMKDGDLILTYAQNRMFGGAELKQATSQGELDEYVNVDISRDGQLMSLWLPRGPLGVRLGATRVKP